MIEGISLFSMGVILFVVIRLVMGAVESGQQIMQQQRNAELQQLWERQRQEAERKHNG
jgi:hypothetical protein